jgi:hypothetical protein
LKYLGIPLGSKRISKTLFAEKKIMEVIDLIDKVAASQ